MTTTPPPGAARRPTLLCLSHLRWDFVFQRPQHLLTRAARSYQVIFFEEPIFQPATPDLPRLERRATPQGITVVTPLLPEGMDSGAADTAQRHLLDGLLAGLEGGPRVAVGWFYTPMALAFAGHLRPDVTVYDCMDELSAFRGAPPALELLARRLTASADIVFAGGRSLYEAKKEVRPSTHLFPSGVDTAHLGRARDPALMAAPGPADQAGLPRPRLGWFGVVDERMDLALLDQAAALRPDWSFVMVGPVVKIDPATLPRRANIHWLGGKSHAELPAYAAGWDAAMMPFALNEATRFISPTKTPEYLAAGLPVVSTPIADVVRDWGADGLVSIAHDAAGFVAAAEALMATPRAAWQPRADARLAECSWDGVWSRMEALIRAAALRRAAPAGQAALPAVAEVNRA